MDINLLYQSPEGHISSFRQVADNPLLLHPADVDKDHRHDIAGGLEIVKSDGDVLYICLEYPDMKQVVNFLMRTIFWLKKKDPRQFDDPKFQLFLVENDGSALIIKRCYTGVQLACQAPDVIRNDRYFWPLYFDAEEWLSAAIRALDEYFMVLRPAAVMEEYWADVKA